MSGMTVDLPPPTSTQVYFSGLDKIPFIFSILPSDSFTVTYSPVSLFSINQSSLYFEMKILEHPHNE